MRHLLLLVRCNQHYHFYHINLQLACYEVPAGWPTVQSSDSGTDKEGMVIIKG